MLTKFMEVLKRPNTYKSEEHCTIGPHAEVLNVQTESFGWGGGLILAELSTY